MTETLHDRLRHGADNIHSIGPDRAAALLKEAGERLARLKAETEVAGNAADMYGRQLDEIAALVGADEAGDGERDTSWKAASPVDLVRGFVAGRREFLERAVCHPGPPLSETEDYDPEADLGELEASVLERMDLELKAERELRDIRKLCEEALVRTPDPARSTMQVVRDLCADHSAARTYRANMEDSPAGLELHETTRRMIDEFATYPGRDDDGRLLPIVRPEHFAGPFPEISGYVKRTAAARAATIDQALRMLKDGQRLAVHDEPERVDILFLDPGQEPPLGQEWTVYGPMGSQHAITKHILAAGGDPNNATLTQIAEAMTATDQNFTYKPNAAGNGLDATPVPRAGVSGTIRIVGGDPETIAALGLPKASEPASAPPHPKAAEFQKLVDDLRGKHAGALNSPETRARLQTEIAGFMEAQRDAPPPPNVDLDDERSDLPNGKIAFKVRVSPELAAAIERQLDEGADRMRRAMTYRPGSPIPERAPADYHPAEYMTPEQEAACEEQRDRFDHDED